MIGPENLSLVLMEKMGWNEGNAGLSAMLSILLLVLSMPSMKRILGVLPSPIKLKAMCV